MSALVALLMWLLAGAAWANSVSSNGTAYVVNHYSHSITAINTATNAVETTIVLSSNPLAVAITPDGTTAYVTLANGSVAKIDTATNTVLNPSIPIWVGNNPIAIAITPDGTTAYVVNNLPTGTVTPINIATSTVGSTILVGQRPDAIAITPNGNTAYVANQTDNTVTAIDTHNPTNKPTVAVGSSPVAIAISPDGSTAYVVNNGASSVTPITTTNNAPGSAIPVGTSPDAVAITPDGETAYVASTPEVNAFVTPIDIANNNTLGTTIQVGNGPNGIAVTPDQAPTAAISSTPAPAGSASSFDGSPSSSVVGSIASYAWDFGDGQTATTTNPLTSHTYTTAGDYTARLTVTDSAGTSLTQVFTGQTASRQGAPQATTTTAITIAAVVAPPPPVPTTPSPSPAPAPASVAVPMVTGTAAVGHVLSVSTGSWSGNTSDFSYQWRRDGVAIPGATHATYTVQAADQGHTLTCAVTASDGTTASTPSASTGVMIPISTAQRCPPPSGRLIRTTLGPVALGVTRARTRRTLPRFTVRSYHTDNFCLSGGPGIRVGYGSTRLLGSTASAKQPAISGRVVLALTANPYYALDGARPGTRLATVAQRLKLGKAIHWGLNNWYIVPGAVDSGVLKVRHGTIEEVGIVNQQLTNRYALQRRLLSNF